MHRKSSDNSYKDSKDIIVLLAEGKVDITKVSKYDKSRVIEMFLLHPKVIELLYQQIFKPEMHNLQTKIFGL